MIIKDEVHGTIEFDGLEERVIDSPEFQRLRRIKQMSVTNLVYPGANHTRFEHSLGTAHLSALIAKKLGLAEDDVRKVKLYALLHDIGHTPFSHEGEDVLRKHVGSHEELGRKRILKGGIADILSENYKPREIADVEKSAYGSIIASDLGADRMDYLKRDALNTGVAYGIIDTDRIVHTLIMEKGQLCIAKGGLEAAENLLVARFIMFSAVYMHRTVRIATAMLYRAIAGAVEGGAIEPERFAGLDDDMAFSLMAGSPKGGKYAKCLLQRKLFKEACSFPRGDWDEEDAKAFEQRLSKKLALDMIVDYPHQFSRPVDFMVKTDEGLRQITSLSTLVQSLQSTEEERRRVLVLAEAEARESKGKWIAETVSALRRTRA